MISKTVTVAIPSGIEHSPVAMLVQVASQYDSSIYLESGSKKVNAKSIMGMMTMGFNRGEQIKIYAEGNDEDNALKKMEQFLSGQK